MGALFYGAIVLACGTGLVGYVRRRHRRRGLQVRSLLRGSEEKGYGIEVEAVNNSAEPVTLACLGRSYPNNSAGGSKPFKNGAVRLGAYGAFREYFAMKDFIDELERERKVPVALWLADGTGHRYTVKDSPEHLLAMIQWHDNDLARRARAVLRESAEEAGDKEQVSSTGVNATG